MIDYMDPVPPVLRFFKLYVPDILAYGISIPATAALPCLLVKNTGGVGYTRFELLCRANADSQAMSGLIRCMNALERYAANLDTLSVEWCERDGGPYPDMDEDTSKPEAWCYMKLKHLEA